MIFVTTIQIYNSTNIKNNLGLPYGGIIKSTTYDLENPDLFYTKITGNNRKGFAMFYRTNGIRMSFVSNFFLDSGVLINTYRKDLCLNHIFFVQGDSGGPLLRKRISDGRYVVFGVASAINGTCKGCGDGFQFFTEVDDFVHDVCRYVQKRHHIQEWKIFTVNKGYFYQNNRNLP